MDYLEYQKNALQASMECWRARLHAGLSQTEVAKRAGVSRSLVSRFESNDRRSYPLYRWYVENLEVDKIG